MSEQPLADSPPQTPAEAFQSVLEGRERVEEPTPETLEEPDAEAPVAEEQQELQEESTDSEGEHEQLLEEESPSTTYRLPVGENGEEVEVSRDDLNNYLLRQQDYTKKTQAIAEERRQLLTERDSIRAIQQSSQALETELGALREADPVEPDATYWEQLKTDNPMQWMIERQEWTERRLEKEQTEKRYAELQQQLQKQQHLEMQQKLAEEHLKLVERVPAWADEKVAQTERVAIRNYGLSQGFSEEEMNQVFDHRAVDMLLKAMRYDQLQARRGELKSKALSKPLSAGAAALQSPRRHTDLTKAKQKLAKSNTRLDANAAFQALLEDR